MSVPVTMYLPHAFDCQVLCENYAIHLARVLVRDVRYFRIFRDCVQMHIPHPHSAEVAQPSRIVSINIVYNIIPFIALKVLMALDLDV